MGSELVTATPRSPVSVQLHLRHHRLVQDKPVENGGKDEGPMASEYLLAGLLACQHSTLVKVAAKRRIAIELRHLAGTMHFDTAGDISGIDLHFQLHAPGPAAPPAPDALATLLRLTEAACTISKALKVPVHSTSQLVA